MEKLLNLVPDHREDEKMSKLEVERDDLKIYHVDFGWAGSAFCIAKTLKEAKEKFKKEYVNIRNTDVIHEMEIKEDSKPIIFYGDQ
jgi:hypothetical protein